MGSATKEWIGNTATEVDLCYSCLAPLEAEATVCLACGHRQYRVCYCGEQIRPDLAICPNCEADWSESTRVKAKRKSHTHGSVRGMVRSSITGAVTFAAAFGFLYFAGGRVAQGMGVEAPASIFVRVWYVGYAIVSNIILLGERVFGFVSSGHVLQFLGLLVVGAGLGALWYLVQHVPWIRVRLGLQKFHRHRRPV